MEVAALRSFLMLKEARALKEAGWRTALVVSNCCCRQHSGGDSGMVAV